MPASLPGTSSAVRRGCPPTPRATELAHLRAPATLAELTPRRAESALGSLTLLEGYSHTVTIAGHGSRARSAMCCILFAPMAGCAAPELADLCAYGRRVMPN